MKRLIFVMLLLASCSGENKYEEFSRINSRMKNTLIFEFDKLKNNGVLLMQEIMSFYLKSDTIPKNVDFSIDTNLNKLRRANDIMGDRLEVYIDQIKETESKIAILDQYSNVFLYDMENFQLETKGVAKEILQAIKKFHSDMILAKVDFKSLESEIYSLEHSCLGYSAEFSNLVETLKIKKLQSESVINKVEILKKQLGKIDSTFNQLIRGEISLEQQNI